MAAPETEIVGVNALVKANSTLIGGQLGAQLSFTAGLIEILDKQSGLWGESIPGRAEWDLSLDNAYTESDSSHEVGANDNAKVEIDYNSTTNVVPGLSDFSATLSAETTSVAGLDDPLYRYQRVTGLGMDLSLSGQYFDPASTAGAAYGQILDAQEAGDTIDVTITFGALSLTGTIRPSDWTLDLPSEQETATLDFDFRHEGAIRHSGSIDSGLDALIDAWFNRSKVTALIEYQEGGSKVDGATQYDGDTWVSEIDLEASEGEELSMSVDLVGDGPLNRATQTVA
jgi:hypothetical protein